MHFMLQWLKNTVPEPRDPEIGGSSPWCTDTAATRREMPAPQNPVSPFRRFTPHPRGHRQQRSKARTAFPCRSRRLAASIWCPVSQIPWHSSAAAGGRSPEGFRRETRETRGEAGKRRSERGGVPGGSGTNEEKIRPPQPRPRCRPARGQAPRARFVALLASRGTLLGYSPRKTGVTPPILSRAPCWRGASTLSVRQAILETVH